MKYSVRSTYHLVYSKMWDFDRKLVYYGIAEVLFSAITPLVGVFMPSLIIACLERQAGVQTLILVCFSAFLVYGAINGIQTFLESRSSTQFILFRLKKFWSEMFRSTITTIRMWKIIRHRSRLRKRRNVYRPTIMDWKAFATTISSWL